MQRSSGKSNRVCAQRITITGAVQGIGFRPFVYQLAKQHGIRGSVRNRRGAVEIIAEADPNTLKRFELDLLNRHPKLADIDSASSHIITVDDRKDFTIEASQASTDETGIPIPDVALCSDCTIELFNPENRRYRYPFISCTACGPRYSILSDLPFDRNNTSMKTFPLCDQCTNEYEDTTSRRFHAQTMSCPQCGPELSLLKNNGALITTNDNALRQAQALLTQGAILAVKGVGGYVLMASTQSKEAIMKLRSKKHRPHKPFALMYPSIASLEKDTYISNLEHRLLKSWQAPIVLLQKRLSTNLHDEITSGNMYLGAILPHSPLFQLLLHESEAPLIITSGNISGEVICYHDVDALSKLNAIADYFLCHNLTIQRHLDDSIAQIVKGKTQLIRIGRGFAPLHFKSNVLDSGFSSGAELKNTVAVNSKHSLLISQFNGEQGCIQSLEALQRSYLDLVHFNGSETNYAACDTHPDYESSRFAKQKAADIIQIQHHIAHTCSYFAVDASSFPPSAPLLSLVWDGTGYGLDGTIWGGECFLVDQQTITRVAHLAPFPLPGAELAIRDCRRAALGLLYAAYGDGTKEKLPEYLLGDMSSREQNMILTQLSRKVNSPQCSSMGRFIDALSALCGLCKTQSFEAQAALLFENHARHHPASGRYDLQYTNHGGILHIDWRPLLDEVLLDLHRGHQTLVPARVYRTLTECTCALAEQFTVKDVLLSGGCFQSHLLQHDAITMLTNRGFVPHWHGLIPPNDAGIAAGQIVAYQFLKDGGRLCV